MTVHVLETQRAKALALLQAAPTTITAAQHTVHAWLGEALNSWSVPTDRQPQQRQVLAQAALVLLSNATIGTGMLAGRVAGFPNRGHYPTHFLWDSAFQNLALELFHPRLAEDSLLLLTENLRVDGMMAHFLCATWVRPHDSQPALVGWAAERLYQRDPTIAGRLLPALARNNRWWLRQRMTKWGIIANEHPMETGWDDTPRFDDGPILPLDMNCYLIKQLQVTYDFAIACGEDALAAEAAEQRQGLIDGLMNICYNEQENRFHDVLAADGKQLSIQTPAIFLPIWAGVLAADDPRAQAMIDQRLLNPETFFGAMPFPSVAYNEPTYTPAYSTDNPETGTGAASWRGPTWLPVAWLMVETLAITGKTDQRHDAMQRLLDAIISDGVLHEYYNSATGEGALALPNRAGAPQSPSPLMRHSTAQQPIRDQPRASPSAYFSSLSFQTLALVFAHDQPAPPPRPSFTARYDEKTCRTPKKRLCLQTRPGARGAGFGWWPQCSRTDVAGDRAWFAACRIQSDRHDVRAAAHLRRRRR